MGIIVASPRIWWALLLGTVLVLLFSLGCGTASQPGSSGPAAPASASSVSAGNQVGDLIRPFTLRLADGNTVTSGDLLSQNRPTLLFFFKKG